jgi:Fe-S oxidoreductase
VLAGVIGAVTIRKVQRPKRFEGSHLREADLILLLIAGIVTTLLLWHASRIGLDLNEWPADWSPISNALSGLFAEEILERVFVWTHVLIILTFLAYLPHSKHLHIATAAINVFFASTRARGHLEPLRFDVPDEEMRFGAGTVRDMTWKQTLDTFSCTECGRCQDVCPAWATGKELSPKLLIMALRDQVFAEGPALVRTADGEFEPAPLVPNAVKDEIVWDCVTCGACVRECPVSIEHVDHIVDLRRHLVMVDSRFPGEAEQMLRDVERASNPWGKAQTERAEWAERLGVKVLEPGDPAPEVLYWVGCAASFDERARTAAESTAKLLKAAKIDFAILGPREACTGDPARRMGNEYLFQAYAEQNVGTLNEAGVTKVVASCPHCFNTLANEYPDFGGDYEVVHHSELLAELVRDGRLEPSSNNGNAITYHDSCYLARHNDVLEGPRELVAAVGEPVEMQRSGKRTFCCGAGGAHMWMEERGGKINEERAREAAETGADALAVACPFCTVMLDDGVRQRGDELRVVDVATLLAESVEQRDGD